MDSGHLAKALSALAPAGRVIVDADELRPYETDGLTAYRRLPRVVVLPETVAEVQAVLSWCARHGVPIVARGAGTGLSGGALPHPEGVLLSLARFQRILEVDPANRVARVEPGVRNLQVSEAAAPYGLYYAPDPSSQIACTIGGNVAENSGGVHCLKYGLTVHNVTGLKWLSYEGELMTAGGAVLASPGYDLLALLHGSEGMLGVLVEATLRLLPRPECRQVLLAAFAGVAEAAEAVSAVIARGIVPAGLEMMDRLAVKAAEQFAHAGYPLDAAAILICEVDGTEAEVAAQADAVARLFEDGGATSVRRAATEQECDQLWRGRKSAFPAVGRIAPDYYCMDGTIPRRALAQVLGEIERMASDYGLEVANVFHAGDGNLHPLILYDANDEAQLERAERLGTEILELCVRVGGTVTGEHGVGVEKLDPMCSQFAAPELARFHALKAAFDPPGILNPGKAVPTLARCAELGGMHVHGGQVPFPELARF